MSKRSSITATYTQPGAFFDEKVAQAPLNDSTVVSVILGRRKDDWDSALLSLKKEERFTNADGSRSIWLDDGSETLYTLYIGDQYSIIDIEGMNSNGEYDILLSNMRGNGWDSVVKTRFGSFRPVNDEDIVITVDDFDKIASSSDDSGGDRH